MNYVSSEWTDSLSKKIKNISFTKQLAPFMRFTKRLGKNSPNGWFRSAAVAKIRNEFERIIKEKGLIDYIMNSTRDPDSDDNQQESLQEALKPIIEKMLNEQYNH